MTAFCQPNNSAYRPASLIINIVIFSSTDRNNTPELIFYEHAFEYTDPWGKTQITEMDKGELCRIKIDCI